MTPRRTTLALATAAAALPTLLAYNVAPSPTFLNQALALALWAWFVVFTAPARPGREGWPLWAALAGLAIGVVLAWGPGALPSSLGWSALGLLAAAALMVVAGAGVRRRPDATEVFAAFCTGWVVAGVANVAIALVQVFWPGLPDGDWLAASGIPGRAVGNLRQPNHLSSVLLWASIGVAALLTLGRLRWRNALPLLALLVFGVVLTASRTGLVSVLLLAAWGALDRRLPRPARGLLLAAPLFYALAWLGMAQWAASSSHAFGGTQRLAEGDISSSRFGIWANTLALIAREPWVGVGFGEFNLAWTLTPFPQRPTAFFDHTHNLPLQLLVELGVPLGGAVLLLLLWALWRAAHAGWARSSAVTPDNATQRVAVLMVLMIGLHSLLEYPLWYSYFLLPAAWVWGFAMAGVDASQAAGAKATRGAATATPWAPLAWVGVAAVVLTIGSVLDYLRVAAIFEAREGAPPLEARIQAGQRSVLFAHHANYAAVTSNVPMDDAAAVAAFASTTHFLLDTRLMMSWAEWLADHGQVDRARYLAARLREFRKTESEDFFAGCTGLQAAAAAASAASMPVPTMPFACEPPQQPHGWHEFVSSR